MQNYADEMVAAIDGCRVFVVLCSEASMASKQGLPNRVNAAGFEVVRLQF